jgi:20S proteasome alpha/beta subunit
VLKALEADFQQDLNGDGAIGLTTTPIESFGSTKLVQGDNNYFLFPVAGSSGPALRMSGVPVVAGQTFGWTPIGAEQTASGYEVAWKLAGADPQYTVWYTDSGGNYLSSPIGAVAGNSALLKALEPSFQQDLNLDGVIGLTTTTVLDAFGSTKLVQGDNNYFLFPVAGSSGPPLRFGGTAVTAGQFGAWTPIGAEQTASGYEIAWRFGGFDQYTVWFTDGAGNYLSSPFGGVSGSSSALQLLEPSFQQDLNVDGVTGLLIEVSGSTRLTQVGNNYFMDPVAGGSGPALKMNGLPVAADQFGAWRAIGAERTASGYEVAFKVTGADQFTVWNTDSSGNYVSNTSVASGFSTAMESLEPSFHQDLNGDGVIGIATRVIEAFGSTQLVQVADQYSMYPVGGASGPTLKLNGAPLTTSQLGAWTVIGAEWDAALGGYQVALKVTGADQYTVWHADPNGNYWASSRPLGVVTGGTPEFEALESNFHQDLNGDGIIGLPPTFDITVHYTGDSTYQSYFTAAAQRWSQVITADLPNVNDFQLGFIDDLLIDVDVHSIDGVGKTLGQSRPDEFRSGSAGLPYHGTIELDSADLSTMASNGTLFSVILHEMGHVLGLGSLWSSFGLTSGSQYTGTNGVNAYHQLGGGAGSVPLETGGGSGTALVHWSEATFGTELMTGFTNGLPGQLSILTIGSLQDLGYTVNYGAADPYSLPGHLQAGALVAASMDSSASASDRDGSSAPADVALLTNYIASAFVTPAGDSTGAAVAAQSPGQDFLTKPAA